jgi:cardiolipin synthase
MRRHVTVPRAGTARWHLVWIILAVLALALVLLAPLPLGHDVRAARGVGAARVLRTSDPAFERTFALQARVRAEPGNAVDLLLDGDQTYPAMWRDLRAARHTILVQQYFARPGAVADSLEAILAERARAGVAVRVLLDAHGAIALRAAWRNRLRASGAAVVDFRPLRWSVLYRAGNRSHVRMVLVDDSVAYTGGFGFADSWLGNGHAPGQWRETNVRVSGPAVEQLRAAFATAWFEASGEILQSAALVNAAPAGAVRAGVFYSTASSGQSLAVPVLALALGSAEQRLWLASSYFVPDAAVRALLVDAARRGVDVRVLTAGRSTDVKVARFAGRYTYGELLRGGVRVYEYTPSMMHAKTVVVDGAWAMVGSMNIDNRSISLNDEAGLVVFDSTFAARMESVFSADLMHAHELTLEEFERRSRWTKAVEWITRLASRLL